LIFLWQIKFWWLKRFTNKEFFIYILGLNIGHDSSAVLIKNKKLVGAVQEERFVRKKSYSGFPFACIEYLLNIEKINSVDVTNIAIAGNRFGEEIPFDLLKFKFGYKIYKYYYLSKLIFYGVTRLNFLRQSLYKPKIFKQFVTSELKKRGFVNSDIVFYDHHLCHAASAYFSSPYDNAIIITQDGKGDGLSGSIYAGNKTKLKKLYLQKDVDSLGQIYSAVTEFLGFRPNRHEGKITGLAAFGNSNKTLEIFKKLAEVKNNFFFRDNKGIFLDKWKNSSSFYSKLEVYSSHEFTIQYEINYQALIYWIKINLSSFTKEDICSGLQKFVENSMEIVCKKAIKLANKKENVNLCLAGGLFANVKINQKLKELKGIKKIYIQPAMGDCGLSLGAAQLEMKKKESNKKVFMKNVYLGPEYQEEKLINTFSKYSKIIKWKKLSNIEKIISELLVIGKIIGRFNGRMEWGPRALGNRSILISPSDKNINQLVNLRLNRTEFMPFAPCVLDTKAKDYFIDYDEDDFFAQFMTSTYRVYPKRIKEIEAVVHIDGTARPQIVTKKSNASLYKVLKNFEKKTGIACLVNTSFNLHEEPIVNSPDDAIRSFLQGAVDVLAINDYLVEKKIKS